MKLITLHQPWASLVALGLKQYETRHWRTDYRGHLLIHAAAKKMGFEERRLYLSAIEDARKTGFHLPPEQVPFPEQLPLGCVVAIADLSDCLQMKLLSNFIPGRGEICIPHQSALERSVGLWESRRYAFRLDNVRPLPQPIPFISRQGKLLDVPPALQQMVETQLGVTA